MFIKKSLPLYLSIILLLIFGTTSSIVAEIYFIYGQPQWIQENKRPFETTIYSLGDDESGITKVWSIGENIQTKNIKTFQNNELVIISEGNLYIEKLHIFPIEKINENYVLEIGRLGKVSEYRLIDVIKDSVLLRVKYKESSEDKENNSKISYLDIKDINMTIHKSINYQYEIRLSGARSDYGGGYADGAYVKRDSLGNLWSPDTDVGNLNDIVLPDSIIQLSQNRGWGIGTYEDEYFALLSVPMYEEYEFREMLVYNRANKIWNSFLVKGTRTAPRLINDKFVAIIAYPDKTKAQMPSVLTDEILIIDPIENSHFIVNLGEYCEVLWIENDAVYYRIDDSLYKARIENDDFVDRQLLLTDSRIKHIHWAFSSGTPIDVKNQNIK